MWLFQRFTPVLALALIALISLGPSRLHAKTGAEISVLRSGQCGYMLLSSPRGMALVKVLDGNVLPAGTPLTGSLRESDFSNLANPENRTRLEVWVDLIDPHNNQALNEYGRHCRRY